MNRLFSHFYGKYDFLGSLSFSVFQRSDARRSILATDDVEALRKRGVDAAPALVRLQRSKNIKCDTTL